LAATSISIVVRGVAAVYGEWIGFVAPSPVFLPAIARLVAVHLMLAKA
jgi:hypothetical protein